MNVLVSSCLLGLDCRYCGNGCANTKIQDLSPKYNLIPICPEQMGGLPTPRPPVELVGKQVLDSKGVNYTQQFLKGSRDVLKLAEMFDCKCAVLKSKSPSCGFGFIYDGTFTGKLIQGSGITADLLHRAGLQIFNENNAEELQKLNGR